MTTYGTSSGIYIAVAAVVIFKICLYCCWACKRKEQEQHRRQVVIVRQQTREVHGVNNPVHPSEPTTWQGPYPSVAPPGTQQGYYPTMAPPGAHIVQEIPNDLPPSYEEAQKMQPLQSPPYPGWNGQ